MVRRIQCDKVLLGLSFHLRVASGLLSLAPIRSKKQNPRKVRNLQNKPISEDPELRAMTMSKNLSIQEEQVFWEELFAVMVRHEERTKVGGLEQPRTRKAESFQHLVRAKVWRGTRKNRLESLKSKTRCR